MIVQNRLRVSRSHVAVSRLSLALMTVPIVSYESVRRLTYRLSALSRRPDVAVNLDHVG